MNYQFGVTGLIGGLGKVDPTFSNTAYFFNFVLFLHYLAGRHTTS